MNKIKWLAIVIFFGLMANICHAAPCEPPTYPVNMSAAKQLLQKKMFDDGIAILEELYKNSPAKDLRALLADAYFDAHYYDGARKYYQEIASESPTTENLTRYAKSCARTNDFQCAMDIYKQLIEKDPRKKDLYTYKLGFLSLDAHDYPEALSRFEELMGSGYKGKFQDEAVWNIAWINYKMGHFETALEKFREIGTIRSRYWEAKTLEKMNKKKDAKNIFEEIASGGSSSYYGYLAKEAFTGKKSKDTVWKKLHKAQINDKFVDSIIEQESKFRVNAVSRTGAIGLMQLMPATAAKLARESGNCDFDPKELFDPTTNVTLGKKYLLNLMQILKNEHVYVIASYNAGEEAVGRWVKNTDTKDIEEFIEEIPYEETNNYVKKVLTNYWE